MENSSGEDFLNLLASRCIRRRRVRHSFNDPEAITAAQSVFCGLGVNWIGSCFVFRAK